LTDHPAEALFDRRASPEGVLALLILAGVRDLVGWYAYRGELGRLVPATPEIEVNIQPHDALAATPTPALAETTPTVVLDLTAKAPGLSVTQTDASVASLEATKLRLLRAIADLTIDDTPNRVAIDAQLAELERRARTTGFALGLANGYPVTIERLSEWSRAVANKNLALAPVSAIVDQQAHR
jgi:hypothetical protein